METDAKKNWELRDSPGCFTQKAEFPYWFFWKASKHRRSYTGFHCRMMVILVYLLNWIILKYAFQEKHRKYPICAGIWPHRLLVTGTTTPWNTNSEFTPQNRQYPNFRTFHLPTTHFFQRWKCCFSLSFSGYTRRLWQKAKDFPRISETWPDCDRFSL